jgi:hypothetical protein
MFPGCEEIGRMNAEKIKLLEQELEGHCQSLGLSCHLYGEISKSHRSVWHIRDATRLDGNPTPIGRVWWDSRVARGYKSSRGSWGAQTYLTEATSRSGLSNCRSAVELAACLSNRIVVKVHIVLSQSMSATAVPPPELHEAAVNAVRRCDWLPAVQSLQGTADFVIP